MKNIFIKTFIMFSILLSSCKTNSQTIINMSGDNNTYPSDYLGTGQYYIKDVNNYLNNFTGTWEYINGNEKFQIILTKIIKYHVIHTDINLNYYEDGITIQYKKYINNVLSFESPQLLKPSFETIDGVLLDGWLIDYGRITKTIYYPQIVGGGIRKQGGSPIYPNCRIKKVPNQPNKITFNLSSGMDGHLGYDKETYAGQPTYSIPNDIILTKI